MTAPVINGLFQSQSATWGGLHIKTLPATPSYNGFVVVPNTTKFPITVISITFGQGSGIFSGFNPEYPVTINPGQSATFTVSTQPTANGGSNIILDTAVFNLSNGQTIIVPLFITTTGQVGIFPSYLTFPTLKIGQSAVYASYTIVNTNQNAALTVNNLAFVTGTDYFLIGAPTTPFIIPIGGQSPIFSVQFTPTTLGTRFDTLNVTLSDATVISASVGGSGSNLQSAFVLSGTTTAPLFAFPNIILQAQPANSNGCEEASSAARLHDFGITVTEKQLLRIRGHYEDLGPATIAFVAVTRRIGQPDAISTVSIPIGTAAADGWIREFIGDINTTGELIQLTLFRVANTGVVSIIDYIPELILKGEVIGGT